MLPLCREAPVSRTAGACFPVRGAFHYAERHQSPGQRVHVFQLRSFPLCTRAICEAGTFVIFARLELLPTCPIVPRGGQLSASRGPPLKPLGTILPSYLGGFEKRLAPHDAERGKSHRWLYTQRNHFEFLINQTRIRLYLPLTD